MKKMLCLAVFALGLATPAVAEDWVLVSIDSEGAYIISGDADSRTDNRAWFKHRYAKPQKGGYNTAKSLAEMDCRGKRHRILTTAVYSKSNLSALIHHPMLNGIMLFPVRLERICTNLSATTIPVDRFQTKQQMPSELLSDGICFVGIRTKGRAFRFGTDKPKHIVDNLAV